MARKRTPLTSEQFSKLKLTGGWNIDDVPRERWNDIPGLQRLDDTVAVMASGCVDDPKILNGILANAGLDILVSEANPKPHEPEGNAYHYVIQEVKHPEFPYVLHGPYRSQTMVNHWFDVEQVETYWQDPE